jgi:site-specific recombinase XerD
MAIRSFTKYASIIDPAKIHVQVEISNVPRKKAPVKVVGHMSEDVLENLFKQPNLSKSNGRRDQFFMILMYDAAARCRELLDLKVGDVNLGKNASVMLTRKGGKKQSVPVSESVATHFAEYLKWFHPQDERSDNDYVFYTVIHGKKNQMSPDAVATFMRGYAAKCRTVCPETPRRVHPHMLRHSRAMHLYRSGMPLALISEFLGHSDVNTTRIYAWADTEMKRQAIRHASPQANASVNAVWHGDEAMIKRLYGIE